MELGLKGKRALVMGASSGLGFAIAQELTNEGARVCLSSRSEERLRKAADAMRAEAFVVADLSQPGAGRHAVEKAAAKLKGLDILVTNAGGPPKGSFQSLTAEQWQQGFQTLWLGATDAIQAAILEFQKNHWGRILLVTSSAAKEPIAGLTVSNGLRAGLLGLTKSISQEVGRMGITINALLPGYTATERLKELKINEEKIVAEIPVGRLGEPRELAALSAFLASDRAAYITGQMIAVDGGALRGVT
jgi:3-oxoacyl-[acyl-carrier protein] reductase